MGIFAGRNAVKLDYEEKLFGALTAAVGPSTSVLLATTSNGGQHMYFDNTLDVYAIILVVNADANLATPGSAPTAGAKIFLLKVPPNRVLNLDTVIPDAGIEGGTQFWVYTEAVPTMGRISTIVW